MNSTIKSMLTVATGVVLGGLVLGVFAIGAAMLTQHVHTLREKRDRAYDMYQSFEQPAATERSLHPECEHVTDAQIAEANKQIDADITAGRFPRRVQCNEQIVLIKNMQWWNEAAVKAHFWGWWPW